MTNTSGFPPPIPMTPTPQGDRAPRPAGSTTSEQDSAPRTELLLPRGARTAAPMRAAQPYDAAAQREQRERERRRDDPATVVPDPDPSPAPRLQFPPSAPAAVDITDNRRPRSSPPPRPATRPTDERPVQSQSSAGWRPADNPPDNRRPAPSSVNQGTADAATSTRRVLPRRTEDASDPFADTPTSALNYEAFLDATITEHERVLVPEGGWRRIAYDLTGGRWNPGLTTAQIERQKLIDVLRKALIGDPKVIVFGGQKGGQGKTTYSVAAGTAFSMYGPDPVVLIDANPDGGSAGVKMCATTKRTVVDLRDAMQRTSRLSSAEFDRYVNRTEYGLGAILQQPGKKLLVDHADEGEVPRLTGADLLRIIDALRSEYPYKIIIIDCGTDVGGDVAAAAMRAADLLLLPNQLSLDSAVVNAGGLEALSRSGNGELVRNAITVLTKSSLNCRDLSPQRAEDVRRAEQSARSYYSRMTAQVIDVPFDPDLAAGGIYNPTLLHPNTERAILELAAGIKTRLMAA